MSNETKPDLWDDAGPFWYREFPADSIEAFVSGEERDLMKIEKDGGSFWLSDTGHSGAGEYATLEAAKRAGDEIIDELNEKQHLTLTEDAGLDPAEWTFRHQDDHVWFESTTDAVEPPTSIVREGRNKWVVQVADVNVGDEFKTPTEAAEFVAQRKAFTPVI
jgi:hypothetical protein